MVLGVQTGVAAAIGQLGWEHGEAEGRFAVTGNVGCVEGLGLSGCGELWRQVSAGRMVPADDPCLHLVANEESEEFERP